MPSPKQVYEKCGHAVTGYELKITGQPQVCLDHEDTDTSKKIHGFISKNFFDAMFSKGNLAHKIFLFTGSASLLSHKNGKQLECDTVECLENLRQDGTVNCEFANKPAFV